MARFALLLVTAGFAAVATLAAQASPAQAEAGRKVYDREKCATCHQIARRGNSRYPLDGVASRLTEDQLRRWLVSPAEMEAALPRMPALRMSTMKPRLNAQDLAALVTYLQTLK
ncbi:MAG TPA: cytochrome c [Vicinamibacterales bacterium]|nr:cytochrome c [Vicinamibacterales bacterium]